MYQKSLTFHAQSGKHDLVTDKDFDIIWSPAQDFDKVKIPEIDGFTWKATNDDADNPLSNITTKEDSQSYISAFNVNQDSHDINLTVLYIPEDRASYNIHYIGLDPDFSIPADPSTLTPGNGTPLSTHDINEIAGKVGSTSDATSKLWSADGDNGYEVAGYKLVYAPSDLGKATFAKGMKDQYVFLQAQPEKAHLVFYDDNSHKFITKDADGKFSESNNAGDAYVESTSNKGKYGDAIAFPEAENTLGQLENDPYQYSYVGITNETATDQADVKAQGTPNNIGIPYYQFGNLDNNPANDQFFVVHVKAQNEITDDTKTIHETIHYVYADGTTAKPDYTKDITFTRSATKNLATGVIAYGPWDKQSATFAKVDSPDIPNYTPDQPSIAAQSVNPESTDIVKTVKYSANTQALADDTKTIHETIHYVYADGTTAKPDYTKDITFTRSATKNLATGVIAYGPWDKQSATFAKVDSPDIPNYTPDQPSIAAQSVNPESTDIVKTVKYSANTSSTPDKPVTPEQPSTPNTPETPVVPTTPDVPGTTPETPTTNPEVPGTPSVPNTSEAPHKQEVTVDTTKVSETPVQNIGESTETKQQGQKLPQTSNQNGSHLALAGLAVTAIASLFGITGERKRKGKN